MRLTESSKIYWLMFCFFTKIEKNSLVPYNSNSNENMSYILLLSIVL